MRLITDKGSSFTSLVDTPLSRKNNRRYEAIVAVDKLQPWLHFNRDLESSGDENNSDSDQTADKE